jgi:hypothetical protein
MLPGVVHGTAPPGANAMKFAALAVVFASVVALAAPVSAGAVTLRHHHRHVMMHHHMHMMTGGRMPASRNF